LAIQAVRLSSSCGRLGVELRIGAQEMQKRREIALETGVLHRLEHLRVDRRHLAQADGVDLVGREVERGVFADLLAVIRLAIGQGFGGQRGARLRHVFVAEERQQLRVGGNHVVGDRRARLRPQRIGVLRRHRRRHMRERRVQRAVLGSLQPGHGGDGRVTPVEHRARHGEAARQPQAHVGDFLVHPRRDLFQPRDVIAVLRLGAQVVALQDVAHVGPERRVAVERHLPLHEPLRGGEVADLLAVHRVVDPLAVAQRLRVDPVQLRQHVVPVGEPTRLAGGVDVIQATLARLRLAGGEDAGLAISPGPFLRIDRLERVVGGRGMGGAGDEAGEGEGAYPGGHGRSGEGKTPIMAPPMAALHRHGSYVGPIAAVIRARRNDDASYRDRRAGRDQPCR
jgi:hypothetical protein